MTPPPISGYIVSPIVLQDGVYVVELDDQVHPVMQFENPDSSRTSYITLNGLYFVVGPNIVSDKTYEVDVLRTKIAALNQTLKDEENKVSTLRLENASLTTQSASRSLEINTASQNLGKSQKRAKLWRTLFFALLGISIYIGAAVITSDVEAHMPAAPIQTPPAVVQPPAPKKSPGFIVIEEEEDDDVSTILPAPEDPKPPKVEEVKKKQEVPKRDVKKESTKPKAQEKPKETKVEKRREIDWRRVCAQYPYIRGCAQLRMRYRPTFDDIFEHLDHMFMRPRACSPFGW